MFRVEDRNSFRERVLSTKGMLLVNFWARWSEECRSMYAIMRDIAALVDEQDAILHIDWERQKRLARELEIFGVPTLLIYINRRELARYSGIINKDELMRRITEAKKPVV